MTIQMLCTVVAPGQFLARGMQYDLQKERAIELLDAKFAKPVPKSKPEKATKIRETS